MPYIQTNGINMYYEERGSGYPLIMIMGLGADGSAWERHIVEFEKHFRCILLDNRGSGKTDMPRGPYDSLMMARDVLGLMDALGIQKANFNGCSMGGMIVQELALMCPERVNAVVFTSSMAKLDAYGKRLLEAYITASEHFSRLQFRRLANLFVYSRKYHQERIDDLMKQEDGVIYNPKPQPAYAYSAQVEVLLKHDAAPRLHQIKAPCLVFSGDSDFLTPASHVEWMAKTLPDAKLEIVQGCGHVFHFEEADRYNRTVVEFLKKNTGNE